MATATLAGFPLKTTPEVGWSFTTGVQPHERVFRVSNAVAQKLAQLNSTVTLRIEPSVPSGAAPRAPLVVQNLDILAIEPTDHTDFKFVRVADGRWRWARKFITRQYNVPRRTGDYKRLAQEGVPVQVQQVIAEVTYAKWSLFPRDNPQNPWDARHMVEDLLDWVTNGKWINTVRTKRGTVVVGARFFEDGATAITNALKFLPGTNVTLNEAGTAVIYDEIDGSEGRLLQRGPVYRGPSLAALVDLKRQRPVRVNVLFDRELELRFDSEAETSLTAAFQTESRIVENVAPIPDVSLTISGNALATGTWARFADLFGAWPQPAAGPKLSHLVVQNAWLWPGFLDTYARPPGAAQADQGWTNRIAAVKSHYRQTYRITKRWADRIKALHPYRVAILDPVRGTRGKACVFTNYAVIPTTMGWVQAASQGDSSAMWNVYGYSAFLSGAQQAAPAQITIEDPDQMIFRIEYKLDRDGETAKILPSAVVGVDGTTSSLPSYDMRKGQQGKGEGFQTAYGKLVTNHNLIVILTVEPGAPNDERICHSEQVGPSDVKNVLGVDVGACNGPEWTIHVSDRYLKARTEWVDTYANNGAIDDAFGLVGRAPGTEPKPDKFFAPTNAREVRDVAIAAAAALYSTILDHGQGQHAIRFDGTIGPTGRATNVEHVLRPNGGTRTTITLPRIVHGIDILSLIPEELQRRILGAADLGSASL